MVNFVLGMMAGGMATAGTLGALLLTHRLSLRRIEAYCDALIEASGEPTGPETRSRSRALS